MIAKHKLNRPGYTLIEMLAVVAVIIIIGGVVSTTMTGQEGNTKVKAAADDVTGSIAMARSHAMEEGRSYRLSLSQDKSKIRVAPDDATALDASGGEDQAKPYVSVKQFAESVTIVPAINGSQLSTADAEGWTRLATFQQDGTCKEDANIEFEIREPGVNSLIVQIRVLTGHTTVNPAEQKP